MWGSPEPASMAYSCYVSKGGPKGIGAHVQCRYVAQKGCPSRIRLLTSVFIALGRSHFGAQRMSRVSHYNWRWRTYLWRITRPRPDRDC